MTRNRKEDTRPPRRGPAEHGAAATMEANEPKVMTGPGTSIAGEQESGSPATKPDEGQFLQIPPGRIHPSKTNPRKSCDAKRQAELAESVRRNGVMQPILVRPLGEDRYEIVAGYCRWTAAVAAGLELMPCMVRTLTDTEALELQLIENVQRADLHPMEEAEGYAALIQRGYTAQRIAEKVGKSPAYVYDRMKLMELSEAAKTFFLDGVLSPSHAILLARIPVKEQIRALRSSNVIMAEATLFDPEGTSAKARVKACSVNELKDWIDRNVRFDDARVDPMLFPESALAIDAAREKQRKVIAITYANHVPPEARMGKTYGPRSWKRADGEKGSKTCEYSKLGFIAIGPHRGESFEVCVNKDHCEIHWGKEIRARKRNAAAKPAPAAGKEAPPREDSWAKRNRLARERQAKIEAAYNAIKKPLLTACAEKVKAAGAGGYGPLARLLLRAVRPHGGGVSDTVPLGPKSEDLVRHAVWQFIAHQASGWNAPTHFPTIAAELVVDVKKIRKEHGPKPEKKAAAGTNKAAAKKGGKR